MNYFSLFGLTPQFDLDTSALGQAYRQQQQACHPDRMTQHSVNERLQALQHSTTLNTAYQTLLAPLARAEYLLQIQGFFQTQPTAHTFQDLDFLSQQLAYREQLHTLVEAQDIAGLDELSCLIAQHSATQLTALSQAFAQQQLSTAYHHLNQLRILDKLGSDIMSQQDLLGDD